MHACFHGGGQGSGRTIRIIRDLTKNMKAMSLKVKAGGGGGHARARRRRRRRGSGAEAEDGLEMQDKDIATAAAAAAAPSSSAKIAPEEERGGKRQAQKCDKCRSVLDDVAEEEVKEEEGTAGEAADHAAGEESDGEWVAEPEPGVLMTLVPRPDGTNHLRKLRFREELFDGPRAAQRWWEDNYDSIVELYSIVQSGGGSHNDDDGGGAEDLEDDEPATPCQSEDDHHQQRRRWQRLGFDSASTSGGPSSGSGSGSGGGSASTVGSPILGLVLAGPNSSKIGRGPGQAQSPKHKCRSLHIN